MLFFEESASKTSKRKGVVQTKVTYKIFQLTVDIAAKTTSHGTLHSTILGNNSQKSKVRACLHGGGGPQVDEVTCLGEVKK